MRATTYLSLLFVAVAGAAGAAAACANGGDDTSYTGDDGGGSGDATTGDGTAPTGDGGTQRDADAGRDVFMCTPVGPSSDCTMPMNLGTLTPGQTLSANGNIAMAGGQAFVAVTFSGNLVPSYHPQIALAEGGTEFAFDVLSDCSGSLLTCPDEEAGTDDAGSGTSTWEEYYADGAAFTSDAFVPIQPAGNNGGVVVRIYRRSGMPLSCNQYSLSVSE